jgi:hypothetical protein
MGNDSTRDRAIRSAENLATRLKQRDAQVRSSFVGHDSDSDEPPMAARLHQARCKRGLDLRLELTLLWAAGGSGVDPSSGLEHATRFEAVDYAALLAMEDPDGKGKRQVSASFKRLESRGLVARTARPGRPTLVVLRRETGDGEAYSRPGDKEKKAGKALYLKIPETFWTNGWINALSPNAIMALLALLHLDKMARTTASPLFLAPGLRAKRYGFSEDTWYKGVKELERHSFVEKTRQQVRQPFNPDHSRYRDAFFLNAGQFSRVSPNPLDDPVEELLEIETRATTTARAALDAD